MAANLGKEKSLDSMELEQRYSPHRPNDCMAISAGTENTDVLQQSADTCAQHTKLSTCNAAAVGYSNTRFTNHDEMYTRVIVDSYTQPATPNSAEENYFIPLAEEQNSELDLNDGCLEAVDHVYCEVLDDVDVNDIITEAKASHHNVLSADQLLNCLPLTGHSCNADVLFNDTDPEQITYDNNSSARIATYENNVDITTYDNSGGIQNHIHPRSELNGSTSAVDVYDEVDETMMYSEVNDSTSSSVNFNQQTTRVYKDRDEFLISNSEYPNVDNTVAPSSFYFRHTKNTILKAVSGVLILIIVAQLAGVMVVVARILPSSASLLVSRQAFTAFRHDPITSPGVVDFNDVALNDGRVFEMSKFSPNRNGYFWLAVSAIGFVGHNMTLAMVYTATDVTKTQVTLNVHNTSHSWCTSFVDISFINKGNEVFVTSTYPINFSSEANKIGQNRSYAFVGFELDSIMEQSFFAVKFDFGVEGLITTTFQNGTTTTATENITDATFWNKTESITICSDDCFKSKNNIMPLKAGWYLVSVSIHCRINPNSSEADLEPLGNSSEIRHECYGSMKGFYSTNSSMWSDTRSRLVPEAFASVMETDSHLKLETDLVASGSALLYLYHYDFLHPYYDTKPSATSLESFSIRALLYEPAHSNKTAWSVLCVNSESNTVDSSYCDLTHFPWFPPPSYFTRFEPDGENVAYDSDSMAVQLDINGIYYIAFTAIVGDGEYTSCSVWQHSQDHTENVLDFTYPSTTSGARVSIQRSRLLLVRESASLTCKAYSADRYFYECFIETHPTFHGFLLYPV